MIVRRHTPRRASIRELARRTGLSTASVSLILRNKGRARPETRRKVVTMAKRLGYVVNAQVAEMMSVVRNQSRNTEEVIGLVSLYPYARPWERYSHYGEIYLGARDRAAELGCRLEPFWILDPQQRVQRLRNILHTRAIRGLICLGAADMHAIWPRELAEFAIVNLGLSIATPLHRVASWATDNAVHLLNELVARGYRRPGLVLRLRGDDRSQHAYAAMFLYHLRFIFQQRSELVLYVDEWNNSRFEQWFDSESPDVIVFYHHDRYYQPIMEFMRHKKVAVPGKVGLACLDGVRPPPELSARRQHCRGLGTRSVEMALTLISQSDFGLPTLPKVEFVPGVWHEGRTLRGRG
ncbi:MAG TPA: LacI family DNA-binding transcriptional regulator [Opitutaceae bacterium]